MTFLVAEIAANWNGSYALAGSLIQKAKDTGFDAVKFACFDHTHWDKFPQFPDLRLNNLTQNDMPVIDDICREVGIEWFATPCYPDAVEWLKPWVKRYKIRYADRNNSKIINAVRKTRKPCFISGRKIIGYLNWSSVYCIPKYPTQYKEIDFKTMRIWDGYSNHCPKPQAFSRALKLDLEVYEIHMVLFHSKIFIDDMVSYDFKQVKRILERAEKIPI